MCYEFIEQNRKVEIFSRDNLEKKELPVVILNSYSDEGKDIFDKCISLKCKDFILVNISNLDWNSDMTPWYSKKINKNGTDFLGKADEYINVLVNEIIPKASKYINEKLKINIDYYIIAGYSLAGLFSVYATYKTDIFKRVVSASGSFWYPDFIEFAKNNKISFNVEKIYFSLGNKESKVRNEVMSKVEKNTKELEKYYFKLGIKTIYEENEGNHFNEANTRIAKGIKWVLK